MTIKSLEECYKIVKSCQLCERKFGTNDGKYGVNRNICPICVARINGKKSRWDKEEQK